jgi:hypothetical protein
MLGWISIAIDYSITIKFSASGKLKAETHPAKTSPGQVAVQVPFILIFDDFDGLPGVRYAGSIIIGLFKQLDASPKCIVILKRTVGFAQIKPLAYSESQNQQYHEGYKNYDQRTLGVRTFHVFCFTPWLLLPL